MLKELRLRANLTQDALAKKVGLKKNTICSYEKGIRTPTVKNLCNLAEALDVTVEQLLDCFKK